LKEEKMQNNGAAGYSLIELIIVISVTAIVVAGVSVNLGAVLVSINIDQAATEISNTLGRIRREAIKNSFDTVSKKTRKIGEFKLEEASERNYSGIILTEQAPDSKSGCSGQCPQGQQIVCISGRPFCYRTEKNFSFENFSGKLSAGHAIFILSKSRKLAIFINPDGKYETAELLNGEWRSRSELQQSRHAGIRRQ
jgi:prepilin-type N-terminal cleavage/methylation domain-containing protein